MTFFCVILCTNLSDHGQRASVLMAMYEFYAFIIMSIEGEKRRTRVSRIILGI